MRPALAMIGAYTGTGFAVVEVIGSRKAFRERLIQELVRMPGQAVPAKQMQRAVAEELRRLRVAGLAGALLQFAALQKLEEDAAKPMRHEAEESRARLRAGMLAFWGTVADLTGQGLKKLVPHLPKAARGLGGKMAIGLQIVGKLAGLFGAGIMAFYDAKNALASAREGNMGLAILYGASAFFGFSAAFLLMATAAIAWAGPVAFVFIVILLGVAVLIEYLKDNKVQAWLSRCLWGKGRDGKYPGLKTELRELNKAMAG